MEKGTEISERLLSERMMRGATHHDMLPRRHIKALQNCVGRSIVYRFRSDNINSS
jgi:hypothetical protein